MLRQLGPERCERLIHDWSIWGREKQQWSPHQFRYTIFQCGRGFGKTRTGAESCHNMADKWAEECGGRMAIIGCTAKKVREEMIEGESGILATQKPWNPCRVYKDALEWKNGVVAYKYSAETREGMRGPNVGFTWCDELAHWADPEEQFNIGVEMSLRIGTHPSCIITTTPKPLPFLIRLAKDPGVRVVKGHTTDNRMNLAPSFIASIMRRFDGTELALQELAGEFLEINERALWRPTWIKRIQTHQMPGVVRTVVAVDPAGSANKKSNETGIIVCALDDLDRSYVLADGSGKHSPHEWAGKAIELALFHGADSIIGERNFGGDMVRSTIQQHPNWQAALDNGVDLKEVTASKSKGHRATPVAAMYQQSRVFHVGDSDQFSELEYQMLNFDPLLPRSRQSSPDRMDALVHGMTELHPDREGLAPYSGQTDEQVANWDQFWREVR